MYTSIIDTLQSQLIQLNTCNLNVQRMSFTDVKRVPNKFLGTSPRI